MPTSTRVPCLRVLPVPDLDAHNPILVVGPSWVGDMVMAQSLYKTLKLRSNAPVDVLAPGWSRAVLARMPEVRKSIELPLGHGEFAWRRRRQLGRSLAGEGYGWAIVLPRSFKSALTPFHAGIPVRTGYRGEMRWGLINDVRPLDRTILPRTVDRFVALGLPRDTELPPQIPPPRLEVNEESQQRLCGKFGLDPQLPAVAMMPGAEYGPAKCWPLEYFAQLAQRLDDEGLQVWILGSDNDRVAGEQVCKLAPGSVNLCGRTRIEDAIDILALANAAVTNDSGLMHIAAAVGTHVIAIYGSTTPAFTPALTANKFELFLDLECSPCFQRECPLGHLRCLREIDPDRVFQALSTLRRRAVY